MEHLPADVILVILHKLAWQDPPSLLRATCATAPFHRTAAQHPNFWKEAFFGPATGNGALLKEFCPEEIAKLDAKVEELCGYKRLVTMLYSQVLKRSAPKHATKLRRLFQAVRAAPHSGCSENSGCEQNLRTDLEPSFGKDCNSPSDATCCNNVMLTFVWLHGRLVFWSFIDGHTTTRLAENPNRDSFRLPLQPLFPVRELRDAFRIAWERFYSEPDTNINPVQARSFAGNAHQFSGYLCPVLRVENPGDEAQFWCGNFPLFSPFQARPSNVLDAPAATFFVSWGRLRVQLPGDHPAEDQAVEKVNALLTLGLDESSLTYSERYS